MSPITVEGVDQARLNEVERNALAVLVNVEPATLAELKRIMFLGSPVVVGPSTVAKFVKLALARGIDLTPAGVVAFKDRHGLGNQGADRGVIGPQTADTYVRALGVADRTASRAGRRINAAGLALVKRHEGCYLYAYLCPAGVPTIGWGHTGGVKLGDRITQARADELLVQDLARFEAAVARLVTVPLTDNEFSALVSFAFNVGSGALEMSTLRRKLNAGDRQGAADELLRWDKAGGGVMAGLTVRRKQERALFLAP